MSRDMPRRKIMKISSDENGSSAKEEIRRQFSTMSKDQQVSCMEMLFGHLGPDQQGMLNGIFQPMLQRDFISLFSLKDCSHLSELILSYLDAKGLCRAELVCEKWKTVIVEGNLWKKLIERKVRTDELWKDLSIKRSWCMALLERGPYDRSHEIWDHRFYKRLYSKIIADIDEIERNWNSGTYILKSFACKSLRRKGATCFQADDKKIVAGFFLRGIKIWERNTLSAEVGEELIGATFVESLQYDDQMIIAAGGNEVRVYDVRSRKTVHTLNVEAVNDIRFKNGILATCSKDKTIRVWDIVSPSEINLRQVLTGHNGAVNAVDLDDKYIVSGSDDRTIKIWDVSTLKVVRTLTGHLWRVNCLQYHDQLIVSSSFERLRVWDVETGKCVRVLDGHTSTSCVTCIRFDSKRVVSGSNDGQVILWSIKSGIQIAILLNQTEPIHDLHLDDYKVMASCGNDNIYTLHFMDRNLYTGIRFWRSLSETTLPSFPNFLANAIWELESLDPLVQSHLKGHCI